MKCSNESVHERGWMKEYFFLCCKRGGFGAPPQTFAQKNRLIRQITRNDAGRAEYEPCCTVLNRR